MQVGQVAEFRRNPAAQFVPMQIQDFQFGEVAKIRRQFAAQFVAAKVQMDNAPVAINAHAVPRGQREFA